MTTRLTLTLLYVASFAPASAQDKKPEPKDLPRIIIASPLGVAPGQPTKLTLRGLRLDQATEVRVEHPKGSAKLLAKSKVGVPAMQDVNRAGDTQAEVEVIVPADAPPVAAALRIVAANGVSEPYRLILNDASPRLAEKEPNPGFRQAQPLTLPVVVEGAINQPLDVDVFRIEARAGQRLELEVQAARYGSACDPILGVYAPDGTPLAVNDDALGNDARLLFTPSRDGPILVVLQDAHDQGGPAHVYRLSVKPAK